MSCADKQAKLMDWVLGELGASEEKELQGHVEHCAECAHSLASLRRVRQALLRQFTDREMPAHLVFMPEKPREGAAGFLASLWRTAALAAAAAVVFLGIVFGGYSRWGNRPAPAVPVASVGLTRPEVEALIRQEVANGLDQQKQELRAASQQWAAGYQAAQARNMALVAGKLDYLESAEKEVWKQTQQQGAVVELIAQNTLVGPRAPYRKP